VRPAVILVLFAAAFAVAGCGCCDDDDYYDDGVYGGTLEVLNSAFSVEGIDSLDLYVPGGPIETYDVFLLPGENVFIDLYPDDYEVDLFWSAGPMEPFWPVSIWDNEITTIVGER
jgi:hypothetical protein